jgi:hypothetical protein
MGALEPEKFLELHGGEAGIWHFSMSHAKRNIFISREDFIYGINSLVICKQKTLDKEWKETPDMQHLWPGGVTTCTSLPLKYDIRIFCYTFMNDHFHLILGGRGLTCAMFMRMLLARISRIGNVTGRMIHNDMFMVTPILYRKQMQEECAYVLRNPIRAGMASPYKYPWCSMSECLLNPLETVQHGRKIKDFGDRERRRILRTKERLDGEIEILDGRILDSFIVDTEDFAKYFSSELELFKMVRKSAVDSDVKEEHGMPDALKITDESVLEKAKEVLRRKFRDTCKLPWHNVT